MTSFFRSILGILLAGFFVFAGAPDLRAERRIGVIMTGDIPYYGAIHEAFVSEMARLAVGDEKIEIVLQRPFPNPISWSNAARKLIAFDVDLIVTYGSPATQAVLYEKSAIPVVYAGVYEPESAAITGKNVTGVGYKVPLTSIIRYLKGIQPIDTIGVICSSQEEDSIRQYETLRGLVEKQNIKAAKIDFRSSSDLGKITLSQQDAFFISGSAIVQLRLNDILDTIKKKQVPTAAILPDDSEAGILMTLFHPPQDQGEIAAELTAQILHGKKPDSLEPQTLRDTELVFNLIVARNQGIYFPIHLLIEASKVIK